MFVLTQNDQVILGPMAWNPRMFMSAIEDDCDVTVSITTGDIQNIPLDLGNGIKIRNAVDVKPELNPKIEMYTGPFWTFTESTGSANYVVVDKPIDLVKKELIEQIAVTRWKAEISGTVATIQDQQVTVDTNRGSRDIFVQQVLLMNDTDTTTWKFPEGWFLLTRAELRSCVNAGVLHVQGAFVWEANKADEINLCTTLQELDAVNLETVVI